MPVCVPTHLLIPIPRHQGQNFPSLFKSPALWPTFISPSFTVKIPEHYVPYLHRKLISSVSTLLLFQSRISCRPLTLFSDLITLDLPSLNPVSTQLQDYDHVKKKKTNKKTNLIPLFWPLKLATTFRIKSNILTTMKLSPVKFHVLPSCSPPLPQAKKPVVLLYWHVCIILFLPCPLAFLFLIHSNNSFSFVNWWSPTHLSKFFARESLLIPVCPTGEMPNALGISPVYFYITNINAFSLNDLYSLLPSTLECLMHKVNFIFSSTGPTAVWNTMLI